MNILNSPGSYSWSTSDKGIKKEKPQTICQSLLVSVCIQQQLQIILCPQHANQVSKLLQSAHTISVSQSLNSDEIKYSLKKQFILSKNTSLWIDNSTVINGNTQTMTNNRHTNGDPLKTFYSYFSESNRLNVWIAKWNFLFLKNHLKTDCNRKTTSVYAQIGQLLWWLMSKATQWSCTRCNLQIRMHHCRIHNEAIVTKIWPPVLNSAVNELVIILNTIKLHPFNSQIF